ncbi:MAG: hypothetical protein CME65_03345 [Halobacteriovoraceae bacterium]|nr:hypothetical protein [Halobacteriovoraceae bacterium]|tara:strand:- start:2351 stop:2662 length:312 start_codon:yes stop_codon:yes gene_type:complete
MKTTILLGLATTLLSFSALADKCSEAELLDAVDHYESEISPYEGGKYNHVVKEVKEPREEGNDKVYEVHIGYEGYLDGYRNLEFRAKKSDTQCIFQVYLLDEV